MGKVSFYAVKEGRKRGVYSNWSEAEAQVKGFKGAVHQKFASKLDAERYLTGTGPTSSNSQKRPAQDDGNRNDSKRKSSSGGSTATSTQRTVFCDGSALGNGTKGSVAGIGVFWGDAIGTANLSERLPGTIQTNNRAEMFAVARILESDPTPHLPLTIATDSQYTINVFSTWVMKWKHNGWTTGLNKEPVKNKDMILYILSLIALRPVSTTPSQTRTPKSNISFMKVKAHVGIYGNEQADRFAKAGAAKSFIVERNYETSAKENDKKKRERDRRPPALQETVRVPSAAPAKAVDIDLTFDIFDDLLTAEELKAMEEDQCFD